MVLSHSGLTQKDVLKNSMVYRRKYLIFTKSRRMPRLVDGDECERGWCKKEVSNPFLSKFSTMPRLVGGELHLKECEFRFNNRDIDLYKSLLKVFQNKPLFYSRG